MKCLCFYWQILGCPLLEPSSSQIPVLKLSLSLISMFFLLMLPFGAELFKYLPDPFNFDKIGSLAKSIIAERTKERKEHVSYYSHKPYLQVLMSNRQLKLGSEHKRSIGLNIRKNIFLEIKCSLL